MVDLDNINANSLVSLIPSRFLNDFSNLQFARYTSAAGVTVLLYDYILTFPEEFEYVWRGSKKITAVKLMFIWNRYFVIPWIVVYVYHFAGLRGPLSDRLFVTNDQNSLPIPVTDHTPTPLQLQSRHTLCCAHPRYFHGSWNATDPCLIPSVPHYALRQLALRVLALYRNRRAVKLGLYSFLAACHIALAVLAVCVITKITPSLVYLSFSRTCYSNPPKEVGYIYLPPMLAESGIMALQVVHHYRSRENRLMVRTPLIQTMYRDGYLYFAAVMTVRFVCFFTFAFGPVSLWSFGNVLDFPLTSALISRFFLQLRGAIQEQEEVGDESSFFPPAHRSTFQQRRQRTSTRTTFRGEGTKPSRGTVLSTPMNEPFPLVDFGLRRATKDERLEIPSIR
ncbi:hypothetical protein FRC18_009705 [Serendipita sp. 400]|nr:hypothetical protein FRC18_009705 [Serendipita sp. 400]